MLAPGSNVAHYRVVGRLATGAKGEVYQAEDCRLGRSVALKVFPLDQLDAGARSRTAFRLSGGNVSKPRVASGAARAPPATARHPPRSGEGESTRGPKRESQPELGLSREQVTAVADDSLVQGERGEDRNRVGNAVVATIRAQVTRFGEPEAGRRTLGNLAGPSCDRATRGGQVITPGATTVGDVAWYIAERFAELELPIWFQPSVDVQRAENGCDDKRPFCGLSDHSTVIRPGDVLHTDVGVCYLRLCTDTQEMGYVLRPGEGDVPEELKEALANGNRWQDHLTTSFETGRNGNQILAATGEACVAEGLRCTTYTHPIGYLGHAPGPTIGM